MRVGNLLDNEVSASFVRLRLDPLAATFEPASHLGSKEPPNGHGAIRLESESDSDDEGGHEEVYTRFRTALEVDDPSGESPGIHYTSARTYRDLFNWQFDKHSFPSRQLARAKENRPPGVKRKQQQQQDDPGAREEIERFKREARGDIEIEIDIEPKRQLRPGTRLEQRQQEQQQEVLGDLLGEYNLESTCILDLDLENEMSRGYVWPDGTVKDIETGRAITPYKDDPASAGAGSSTRGSSSSRAGARGRPFPSRGRGRATPNGSAPINGGHVLSPQTSTRSLPSTAQRQANGHGRGRGSTPSSSYHHPSLPSRSVTAKAKRQANPSSPYATLLSQPQARQIVPPALYLTPSATPLQRTMLHSWHTTCAKPEYQQAVLELLEWMTETINVVLCRGGGGGYKGKRRFEVDVFGSVAWGGETGSSGDLDLVIVDHGLPQGYVPELWRTPPGETPAPRNKSYKSYKPPAQVPGVYDLYRLAGLLRQMGMTEVQVVRSANTPIVKFKTNVGGSSRPKVLECDINVNDLGGWHNSCLILAYCEISPYVLRPMIHALKRWASSQGINDNSGASGPATMSSYCLVLMAIAYLQQSGNLPNLQADVHVPIPSYATDRDDPDAVWVNWGKSQGQHAHVSYHRQAPAGWKPYNPNLTAAEALKGFFTYFASKARVVGTGPRQSDGQRTYLTEPWFDREQGIVSILNGGIISRAESYDEDGKPGWMTKEERMEKEPFMGKGGIGIQPANWRERKIVVQDPFIWTKNCTGSMHVKGMDRWIEAVDRANQIIETKPDSVTLDDLLVPPPPPPTLPSKNKPRGGGAGDRLRRYAQRMQGSRGRGRGGGPAQTNDAAGVGAAEAKASTPTEKLVDI